MIEDNTYTSNSFSETEYDYIPYKYKETDIFFILYRETKKEFNDMVSLKRKKKETFKTMVVPSRKIIRRERNK